MVGVQLSADEVYQLLQEVVACGGGVTVDVDEELRFRLIQRDGRFELKRAERRRTSTLPPFR